MIRSCIVGVALTLLVSTGCMKTSEKYCGLHPDDTVNCPRSDDGSTACTSDQQCMTSAPATPVCDIANSVCVQCLGANDAACVDTTPTCGADNRCVGCSSDADCGSAESCLPTGACGGDDTVAYVEMNATGTTCTKADPCDRVSDAMNLQPERMFIKITGAIDEGVSINDRDVTLFGAPGAKLHRSSAGTVVNITSGSNVSIYDLEITRLTSGTFGIQMQSGATGSLTLRRVAVTGHDQRGLAIMGGRITIHQSRISDNPGGGLDIRDGTMGFEVRNTFIYVNGNDGAGTTIGGVRIEPNVGGKFEFNTVVYNEGSGSTHKPGVSCAGASNTMNGNIVLGNRQAFDPPSDLTQVNGDCTVGTNFVSGTATVSFEAPLMGNFHLTAASPTTVLDAATDCSTVTDDFDGDARPYNGMCDFGADEYTP